MGHNAGVYINPYTSGSYIGHYPGQSRSLFKGPLDIFLYLLTFGALPLYSIYTGLANKSPNILFTALGCCICVMYDCYSRWDNREGIFDTVCLILLFIIYSGLLTYTFFMIGSELDREIMGPVWPFWLLFSSPGFGLFKALQILPEYILLRRD